MNALHLGAFCNALLFRLISEMRLCNRTGLVSRTKALGGKSFGWDSPGLSPRSRRNSCHRFVPRKMTKKRPLSRAINPGMSQFYRYRKHAPEAPQVHCFVWRFHWGLPMCGRARALDMVCWKSCCLHRFMLCCPFFRPWSATPVVLCVCSFVIPV
jgi:hypothetical protein